MVDISKCFSVDEYWQNFNLGIELDIAGTFLYNGIDAFDKIRDFRYTADLFEVLYNLSIGMERLMKIVVVLSEFDISINSEEFERTLITHNHMELRDRIKSKHEFLLEKPQNTFIQLLTEFYKSMRYDRYGISSVYNENKEKKSFIEFIKSNLEDSTITEDLQNNNRIKRFLGRTISKMTTRLYEIIRNEAHRHNIFTYELKYDSKAARIFWSEELDFYKDNIYKKEILLHLLANLPKDEINECNPLHLECFKTETYIKALFNHLDYANVCDEIETIYENDLKTKYNTSIKQRLQDMEHFGILFDIDKNELHIEE